MYVCMYICGKSTADQRGCMYIFYMYVYEGCKNRQTEKTRHRHRHRRRSVLGAATWICRGVPLHPWMDAATQEEDLTLVSRRNSTPPAPPPKALPLLAFPLIALLVSKQEPDMCEGIFRKQSSIVIFMSSSCICNNG